MTCSRGKLVLVHDDRGGDGAMPQAARALVQARNPQAVSALRASIDYRENRAIVRPMFTVRHHKTPVPRGHRTYLGDRG